MTLKEINLCNTHTNCKQCKNFKHCIGFAQLLEKHGYNAAYSHFDYRTNLKNKKIRAYVLDPEKISRHGFFPFVNFTKKETKYSAELPDHIKYKERQLFYASHLDRCIYQYYSFLINEKYNAYSTEHGLDDVAIAYRNNSDKCNIHCAKEAFDFLKSTTKSLIIINDFTSYFDNLDHQYLTKMLCKLLNVDVLPADYAAVMKNITKFSWLEWADIIEASGNNITTPKLKTKLNSQDRLLDRHQFRKAQKLIHKNTKTYGIPQGSPISATLANIYLMDFDVELKSLVESHQGTYKRYCDDTIVILPYTNEEEKALLKAQYDKILAKYNGIIYIKPKKTEIASYDNGCITTTDNKKFIDYLGFRFCDNQITMRPRSITRYFYRLKRYARRIYNNLNIPTHISYSDIYKRFSDYYSDDSFGNFISYTKKADRIIGLEHDKPLQCIIKNNKMYIRKAIKKYGTIIPRSEPCSKAA